MNALEALREANLISQRQGEWATLREINASQGIDGGNITHTQLSGLVKAGSAESAPIEGQTMYRSAGQAIKEFGGEGRTEPYEPPGQDGEPRGGKDYPFPEDDQYLRGGPTGGTTSVGVPIPLPDVSQLMT